jgi:hypothetical protein
MKIITYSILFSLAVFCSACGINAQEIRNDDAWKKIDSWRMPMPSVKVLSGNELMIGGIRCRLFGVKLPQDVKVAAQAKRFLELYVRDYGRYYSIYNTESPVSSKDGVPLIWFQGIGEGGWAQETLVQAGLLDVDYSGFEKYHFRVPVIRGGEEEYDWKRCFKEALASHQAGEKPHILFDWPESKKK